ncbi:MAG TPA: hypothetical protein VF430_09385 [Verrucomicrobiae bacterium]|jgi:hypothetical protein
MNTQFQRAMPLPTITNCALTLAGWNVFGLGGEYANGQTLNQPAWPAGMKDLVNVKQRVGGMFVDAEDIFFYSGTAPELSAFLDGYAKIQNIERHRLILHRGAGSLVSGNGRPCDWKLQGRPGAPRSKSLMGMVSRDPGYVLEVHFWTEGRIALDEVAIPNNIEVVAAKLNALT